MKNKDEGKKKKKLSHKQIVLLLFVAVVGIEVINVLIIEHYYDKLERASFFGSYHGAISAVFTGLAAAFTLYLIFLQREEIQQNEENRRSDEAVRRKERFYQKFFQLIELWRNAINSLEYKNNRNEIHTGISCFNAIEERFQGKFVYEDVIRDYMNGTPTVYKLHGWTEQIGRDMADKKNLRISLNHEFLRRELVAWIQGELDFTLDYLSLTTLLFNQIKNHASNIDDDVLRTKEQEEFAEIIFALISHDELVYLMYAGASGGYPEIKQGLEKFKMLTKLNNWHWKNATTGYELSSYPGRT